MHDGNVRVAVRIRPLSARERLAGSTEVISIASDSRTIVAAPDRAFTFDTTFGTFSNQSEIFEELSKPLLDSFIDGFNCTIFAYGQTGSGKTFTMGTGLDGLDDLSIGIIPRSMDYLVSKLEKIFNGTSGDPNSEGEFFEIYCSFLELYNEEIVDLLNMHSQDRLDKSKRPVLTIREDPSGLICVTGIKEEKAKCMEDIMEFLRRGTLCRTTKSTDMNLVSSRSHAIFSVILRQRRTICNEDGTAYLKNLVSKLHFVDLAGSERLKRTNAVGDRAKESISINSGLLALGNVISALGDESKKATHVPYRDSKLTRLLQDSLGGNSRTVMIACISPSSDNYNETMNTLKYANRARNIKNNAQINEDASGNSAFEIMQLKKQIASLKQEILQLRGLGRQKTQITTGGSSKDVDEVNRLRSQNRDLQKRYDLLQKDKISIEAERDFYKSSGVKPAGKSMHEQMQIMKDYLKTISDLRAKIAEMEATRRRNGHALINGKKKFSESISSLMETPKCFGKARDLIERTRLEMEENETVFSEISNQSISEADDSVPSASRDHAAFAAAVSTRTELLLGKVKNDLQLKEELIMQIENIQQEYMVMRRTYEERMKLLQDNMVIVQRERDQALKSMTPKDDNRNIMRVRYEDRIRKMGKEINELKGKLVAVNRDSGAKTAGNDILIRNLRASLQTIKTERARLQAKLDEVTLKLRSESGDQDVEIKELRNRERKASEQARKYKKAYDFQKRLLQKRIEQYMHTKNRVKVLVQALRRHRIQMSPSVNQLMDSPSFQRLGFETPTNRSASRCSSGLASQSVSAADLESVSEIGRLSPSRHDDDDDIDAKSPTLNPLVASQLVTPEKQSDKRRKSLISKGQPLIAPPGSELPRSVLRMSPLIPRRRDLFARIADAASLSLATTQLQQMPNWSTSGSTPASHLASNENITDIQTTSPMKIDQDIVEFYRSSLVD